MRRIVTTILISAAALSAVSCSFLDREPDIIEAGTFYNSESEVQYGLAGIYGVMNNEQVYGNYYSLMLSNVDDLSYFNRSTTNNFSQQYTHDASSTEIYDAWKELYAGIGNANGSSGHTTTSFWHRHGGMCLLRHRPPGLRTR